MKSMGHVTVVLAPLLLGPGCKSVCAVRQMSGTHVCCSLCCILDPAAVRYIAWPHEQYPSWVLLELGPSPAGVGAWTSPQGAQLLQGGFQQALDALRSADVAAAAAAPKATGATPAAISALAGLLGITDAAAEGGQDGRQQQGEEAVAADMAAGSAGGGDAGIQRSWSVESLAGLQQPSGLGGSAYDSQVGCSYCYCSVSFFRVCVWHASGQLWWMQRVLDPCIAVKACWSSTP